MLKIRKSLLVYLLITMVAIGIVFSVASVQAEHPEAQTLNEAMKKIDKIPEIVKLGDSETPSDFLGKMLKAVLGIIGTAALVIIVYSGIMWMVAGGNDQRISKARNSLIMAALGLFVVFASYTIVKYVIKVFGF